MTPTLSGAKAIAMAVDGDKIVDVRGPSDFARGHLKGALNLPFSQKGLAQRLSDLVPQGSCVVLIAEDMEQAESGNNQLTKGGYSLTGTVLENLDSWHNEGLPMDTIEEISLEALATEASAGNLTVLDVREPIEWEMGHVPEATLISLGDLPNRTSELPSESKIAVICEAGIRSSTAVSLLKALGFSNLINVPGGTGGYRAAGFPVVFFEGERAK
jgi:hydroxyacylglutathione hydrolase